MPDPKAVLELQTPGERTLPVIYPDSVLRWKSLDLQALIIKP